MLAHLDDVGGNDKKKETLPAYSEDYPEYMAQLQYYLTPLKEFLRFVP